MGDENKVATAFEQHDRDLGYGDQDADLRTPKFSVLQQMQSRTDRDVPQVYPKKRLIICCDGTWNTDDLDGKALTNVARIARCISDVDNWMDPKAAEGAVKRNFISQIVHYQPGVGIGTGKLANGWDALTGRGLSKAIRSAYSFICLNRSTTGDSETTGDTEVVLIGFSRGAFTVRCVAQFMMEVGLLTKSGLRHLPRLFKLWKEVRCCDDGDEKWQTLTRLKSVLVTWKELATYETNPALVRVQACAVWDTVSAVGVPMVGKIRQLPQKKYRTVNGTIPKNVKLAIQALSLDERRRRYKPMIWATPAPDPDPENDQRLIQCWFAGNHSDVGGGNKDMGLANLALAWMIGQLTDKVHFDMDRLWVTTTTRAWSKPSPTGAMHGELQHLERLCKVVATSPVTLALLRSKISWGSHFQRVLGGAKPRKRNQGEVHYSVYTFHQLGIADYREHFLLGDAVNKDESALAEAVRAAIAPLSGNEALKFEGDILARWATHELCAHVNIKQARTTAEVIEETVLRDENGRRQLSEPIQAGASYEAAVPLSAILSAVHGLAKAYNDQAYNDATDSRGVHALENFCNQTVNGKPRKPKRRQTPGTFTFSIVDARGDEEELVVSSGQLTFTKTFSLLMGRAHNITGVPCAEEGPDDVSPCQKCQKIWPVPKQLDEENGIGRQ